MAEKRTGLFVAALFAAVFTGPLQAATDVLTLVPNDAVAIVVVNRVGETSGKLEKLLRRVQAPLPEPLALLQKTAGAEEGLDEEGSMLLAIMVPDDAITESQPLAVVPVSDYAKFIAQFGGDESETITEVTMRDQQLLAAKQGGYAILVDADNREMLTELLEATREVSPAITPLKDWIADNDVAAAILPTGIKRGLDTAIKGLDAIKQVIAMQASSNPDIEQMTLAFDMYSQMFKFCRSEIDAAAVGLRIDQDGNVRVGGRVRFRDGGELAKLPNAGGMAPAKLVQGIPADDYVFAGGGTMSPKMMEAMMQWSFRFMKSNSKMYGLDEISDDQIDKLLEMSMTMVEGIEGMGFRMAPGEADDPIYSNLFFTMRMQESSDFLANYRNYVTTWNDMIGDAESAVAMKFDVNDTKIVGKKALELTVDMRHIMTSQIQDNPEAMMMMVPIVEKLFGADGEMKITLVQIDSTTIAGGIGAKAQVVHAVKQLQDGKAGMDKSKAIAKTARLLPKTASFACFTSPHGAVAWVNRLVQTFVPDGNTPEIPPMEDTTPLGFTVRFGPNQLETETVVSVETFETIGRYVEQLQE